MRTLTRSLFFAGLVGLPAGMSVAFAAEEPASPHTFTANVTLASQYIYRGITQTAREPAIQGGRDYSHASGFYVGTWASNISWFSDINGGSSSMEWDFYGGYKNSIGDVGYDLGVLIYYYPGRYPSLIAGTVKPNTTEIYGALSYKWVTGKVSYVVSDGLFGVDNADSSWYFDLTANVPIADGWTATAHAGHQEYDGTACAACASSDSLFSYTDWKLGISKDLGSGWSASAFYTDTDAKDAGYKIAGVNGGRNLGDSHFVVTIGRAF